MWISKAISPLRFTTHMLQNKELQPVKQWHLRMGYTDRTVGLSVYRVIIVTENCFLEKGKNVKQTLNGEIKCHCAVNGRRTWIGYQGYLAQVHTERSVWSELYRSTLFIRFYCSKSSLVTSAELM